LKPKTLPIFTASDDYHTPKINQSKPVGLDDSLNLLIHFLSVLHDSGLIFHLLVGGETAEMPGMYPPGEYDLAGFTVGAVGKDQLLPKIDEIKKDDVIIGVASSGVHSNGLSLVRKIVEKYKLKYSQPSPFMQEKTLGEYR
jgi:hypothetical protein